MENRKKLLYLSPMPPKRSGISEYSVVLIKRLLKYYDITLLTDGYEPEEGCVPDCVTIQTQYTDFKSIVGQYDQILYNMGNNYGYHKYIYDLCLQYPGTVILHDVVLYDFFLEDSGQKLYQNMYEQEGPVGLADIKWLKNRYPENWPQRAELPQNYSFNTSLLKSGNRFMVHSRYAYNKIIDKVDNPEMVRVINLLSQNDKDDVLIDKKQLYRKFGIPEDGKVIISAGNIVATKLYTLTCDTVRKVRESCKEKFCYVMVGSGNYADEYIDHELIIKTGYTTLEEFNSFIAYADGALNLRYPSRGETSAALIRIMEFGIPCIVNPDGWFSELPESCVISVPVNELEEKLGDKIRFLIEGSEECKQIGRNAKEYIKREYSQEVIAERLMNFMENK